MTGLETEMEQSGNRLPVMYDGRPLGEAASAAAAYLLLLSSSAGSEAAELRIERAPDHWAVRRLR
ncbi:MAG TPA: hypothetical protein VEH84_10365 [Alphaproteobacteria bacterium]|nr:hypothetical protein [Alphaproteobacteria bacterium]